jgi:hypothetical protein
MAHIAKKNVNTHAKHVLPYLKKCPFGSASNDASKAILTISGAWEWVGSISAIIISCIWLKAKRG